MVLFNWSSAWWASASWEVLSIIPFWDKGLGGVHWGGSLSMLHPSIYLPCSFKLCLCCKEGLRLVALYRLPVPEQDNCQIPLTSFRLPWNYCVEQPFLPSWISTVYTTSFGFGVGMNGKLPLWPQQATVNHAVCPGKHPGQGKGSRVQGFMNEVFWECLHKVVQVYIYDILGYSQNLAKHCNHVALFLRKLRDNNSRDGIQMD